MKTKKTAFAPKAMPPMPAAVPMSTKVAPSVSSGPAPTVSAPAPGAKMGGHNPDNMLPPTAFHAKGR